MPASSPRFACAPVRSGHVDRVNCAAATVRTRSCCAQAQENGRQLRRVCCVSASSATTFAPTSPMPFAPSSNASISRSGVSLRRLLRCSVELQFPQIEPLRMMVPRKEHRSRNHRRTRRHLLPVHEDRILRFIGVVECHSGHDASGAFEGLSEALRFGVVARLTGYTKSPAHPPRPRPRRWRDLLGFQRSVKKIKSPQLVFSEPVPIHNVFRSSADGQQVASPMRGLFV